MLSARNVNFGGGTLGSYSGGASSVAPSRWFGRGGRVLGTVASNDIGNSGGGRGRTTGSGSPARGESSHNNAELINEGLLHREGDVGHGEAGMSLLGRAGRRGLGDVSLRTDFSRQVDL